MNEKFKLDENGMIMDNDPIYGQLNEWHENDEYDKILETIYAIPHEMWSNDLWFRVISALNNKEEYDESVSQIEKLAPRCKTNKDIARLYYMRGYIHYMQDQEIKALDYYTMAMQLDPERDLEDDCEECREYISGDIENLKELSEEVANSISERMAENSEKTELSDDDFSMMLAFLPGIMKIPQLGKSIGFKGLYFKFDDDEKQIVKDYLLSMYGIEDAKTLQETFRNGIDVDRNYEGVKAYINGTPRFDADELNENGRKAFFACKMFVEGFIDRVPEGGLIAWNVSERIGLLRLAYGCDLMPESEYKEALSVFTDNAKKWYSSWEEYIKGVIFGGGLYMFMTGQFSIKDALDFIRNILPLFIKSDLPDIEWHKD